MAGRVLTEAETRVLLKLLTRALEARTVVAGRVTGGAGGNDVMVMRLMPSPAGSAVRTAHGTLLLPGLRLDISAARGRPAAPRHGQGTPMAEPRAAAGSSRASLARISTPCAWS